MSQFTCAVCRELAPYAQLSELGCPCLVCHACAEAQLNSQLARKRDGASLKSFDLSRMQEALQQQHQPGASAACPGCHAPVPTPLLRQLVPEALQRAEDALVNSWINQQGSIVRCPQPGCGALIERLAGSAGSSGGGESAEARAHFKVHRFRCPLCSHSFCDACLASPYHQGLTCEQHAAPQCPYCDVKVLPNSTLPPAAQLSVRELRLAAQRAGADASWCLERRELELLLQRVQQVCGAQQCRQKLSHACTRQLACGHWCCGLRGEASCTPCLQPECLDNAKSTGLAPTASTPDCCFCFEPLPTAPCILLTCKHACHVACAKARLLASYPGPDISFSFLFCPLCGDGEGAGRHGNLQMATAVPHLQHPALQACLKRPLELREQVVALSKKRLHLEGLARSEPQLQPGGLYDGRPADYALRKFLFFECAKCKRPYFGGARGCGVAGMAGAAAAGADRSELLCGECCALASGAACPVHENQYTEYKCRYCCSLASWFCWGSTHMCNRCHDEHNKHLKVERRPCDPSTCALPRGMAHPAPGKEFCLGCGLCRRTATDAC